MSPHLVAVEHGAEQLDFAGLERASDAVAGRLRALGVEPGVFVALCVERSAAMVVLLLGILKAGGSYVALDPTYPEARLNLILDDTTPGLVVVSESLRQAVPATEIPLVSPAELTVHSGSFEDPDADPERLAFITYTSGTTGRPKGVMHVHASSVYLIGAITPYLNMGPGTRFLQFYPLTWEIQVLDIFAVLASGGTVVIPPADVDTSGPALVEFMHDARITTAMLPPALLAELIEEPALPCLHTLTYIGEVCLPHVAERWGAGRRFVNVYGPTEVTVAATASDERRPGEAPPIGKPLPGREIHVLDEHMRPVAPGEPGELYVGGTGIARGYRGLPELTEKAFPPDPFSDRQGARLYRTGDRVRVLPDGNLDFLGRVDDQLNVRGQRVERGEIEAVLAAHPGVRSCAVVVTGEGPDARLVAFVCGDPGVESGLPERLATNLPPVMVPSAVVRLERLPLNQHGKVDFKALARHEVAHSGTGGVENDTQAALARIWEQVVGVGNIGAADGFRALGGTSLQAVRALTRIRDEFGVALTARELLGEHSLAGVAGLIAASDRAGLTALSRVDAPATHPASLHQRRLWMLAKMKQSASVAYNETSALRLRGRLDVPALRLAVQDLADRHDAFRSSFHLADGQLYVEVAEHAEVELSVVREADPAELGAVPVDLALAPLLRAVLVVVGPDEHVLVLVTHHIVADGLSIDVIDADLAHCYAARRAGRAPEPLPLNRLRPRDHAAWQHATVDHPALTAGLARWKELLDGAPTEVPFTRLGSFNHRGERLDYATGPVRRRAIERLARDAGATPFAVCLVALAVLVARHTGQRDVLIGSPYSGRPCPEADDVIGFFTNTAVMRVRFGEDPIPLKLLADVDDHAQEALEHQHVDFGEIVRAMGARPGASGQPLVQVVLAHQGPLRPKAGLIGLECTPELVDNGTAKADLTIEINEVGDEFVIVLPYSENVFTRPVAQRLLAEYAEVLDELTTFPDRPVRLASQRKED
ncbi:non-ribosomal peptide synthetase [Lentzea waywayandensis]|uniref:non-ribosomal peptide synthetase n=1 Tax=Lentzea waywayandensis TaxID=84724 RepID=UPI0011601D4A|nr:non-ribosomal peptide synthetase [Lentzea waywayandensis]